jgi:Ni,Fe-hydrogenase maturation factor
VHDLGIADALHAARLMGRPLRGTLIGVEPARVEAFTAGLSPPVAAALPALQAAAIREAELLLAGG